MIGPPELAIDRIYRHETTTKSDEDQETKTS
jgi:hypothetical protein